MWQRKVTGIVPGAKQATASSFCGRERRTENCDSGLSLLMALQPTKDLHRVNEDIVLQAEGRKAEGLAESHN